METNFLTRGQFLPFSSLLLLLSGKLSSLTNYSFCVKTNFPTRGQFLPFSSLLFSGFCPCLPDNCSRFQCFSTVVLFFVGEQVPQPINQYLSCPARQGNLRRASLPIHPPSAALSNSYIELMRSFFQIRSVCISNKYIDSHYETMRFFFQTRNKMKSNDTYSNEKNCHQALFK